MATVTRTVGPGGAPTYDYSTLAAWEAGEQTDLVAAGDNHVCECYTFPSGLQEASRVIVEGWTTGPSNNITIRAASGHAHTGIPKSGFWMTGNPGSNPLLSIRQDYTVLQSIDIDSPGGGFEVRYSNCLTNRCLSKAGSGRDAYVWAGTIRNSLAYMGRYGFAPLNSSVNPTAENCVAANCTTHGFWRLGAPTLKNCVAYLNATNYSFATGWGAGSTNNATSTGTDDAPGPNTVTGVAAADFVDAANDDYHVSGTGSKLYGTGANLSTDFTDDWEGDTRSQWDIGADEYVAGGPATHEGLGALKADAAKVVGAGVLQHIKEGSGALKAQLAKVTGLGAVVRAGTGALKAQPASVIGLGEIAGAISGLGALKAQAAKVVSAGVVIHVGTAALKAQAAKVVSTGVTIGTESGAGVLKAEAAKVTGAGDTIHLGTGVLKAGVAKVVSAGTVISEGDLQLTPADIDAIQNAVWQRMMIEGLPTQVLENWRRRGLDPNNPHIISRQDNQIRVGDIIIDLTGDELNVTQTRRP